LKTQKLKSRIFFLRTKKNKPFWIKPRRGKKTQRTQPKKLLLHRIQRPSKREKERRALEREVYQPLTGATGNV